LTDSELSEEEIKKYNLENYFDKLNNPPKGKKSSKYIKATSKQFRAAVNIIDMFLNNISYINREEIVNYFDRNADEENKLGTDAYKHALSFLETSKIITNIYNNKKSINWSLSKAFEIYIPTTKVNRTLKAKMIVSILNPAINYETYTMATRIFKSNIYELKQTSLYDSVKSKIEVEMVSEIEENPYLIEELAIIQTNPNLGKSEFMELMYKQTNAIRYLPKETQETFVF